MTKQEIIDGKDSCFNNSKDDEPIFVLVARDVTAPNVVDAWADMAEGNRTTPAKVQEARDLANRMRVWQLKNYHKIPD